MTKIKIFNRHLNLVRLSYLIINTIFFLLVCLVLANIVVLLLFKESFSVVFVRSLLIGIPLFISLFPIGLILTYIRHRHNKELSKRFNLTEIQDFVLRPSMWRFPKFVLSGSAYIRVLPDLLLYNVPSAGEYRGFKLLYFMPGSNVLNTDHWIMALVHGKETPDLKITKKTRTQGIFKSKNEVKTLDPLFDEKLTVISRDSKFVLEILDSKIRSNILKLKKPHIILKELKPYGYSVIYRGSFMEADMEYMEKVVGTLADIADKIRDMN